MLSFILIRINEDINFLTICVDQVFSELFANLYAVLRISYKIWCHFFDVRMNEYLVPDAIFITAPVEIFQQCARIFIGL